MTQVLKSHPGRGKGCFFLRDPLVFNIGAQVDSSFLGDIFCFG